MFKGLTARRLYKSFGVKGLNKTRLGLRGRRIGNDLRGNECYQIIRNEYLKNILTRKVIKKLDNCNK
jgi:hypothetical protein